jgi:2-succinyl-6-hydroxy-2,4-cyclohexadiene-1-carboxylate synthase
MNLDIRGVNYHIEAEGTTSHERTAVLLHGFSGSSLDWSEIATKLRAMDRGVVAIDLVGHGKTESPPDPARYTMTETVRDLDQIASRLGISEADWVGYSMGGRVALHMALAHPERVGTLVLESASAGIEDAHAREKRRESDNALASRIEERGVEWFADYWGALPLFETQWELPPATLASLRQRRLANLPAGLADSLRGMGQGAHEYVGGRLPDLRGDVLLVAGGRDLKYVEVARRLSALIPASSCVIVPEAGHAVHLESPEAFTEALAAHWNVVPQAAEASSSSSP